MPIEIERKFLVKNTGWRRQAIKSVRFKQGYLGGTTKSSVRVRLEGDKAFLNIKGATLGIVRREYEYPIPMQDAEELLQTLCDKPLIEKQRYYIEYDGHTWEVDEFGGENQGLVVAEVELQREDESLSLPDWVGREVSGEEKYYNVNLIKSPYKSW